MFKILKDLRKQGIEIFKNFENRFSESNAFNIAKERYQSLNVRRQKLIKYALIACLAAFIVYPPMSYMFSSMGYWSDFKNKYQLSLDLLKIRNKNSNLLSLSAEALELKINKKAEKYSLSDFEVTSHDSPFPKAKSVRKINFKLSFKHLNIKQAVRLGAELNALPQMRLSEISLSENIEYEKHYDVIYQLSAFVSQRGIAQSPVIKRWPVNKNQKSPDQIGAETGRLKEGKTAVKRKKRRKRKAVGD